MNRRASGIFLCVLFNLPAWAQTSVSQPVPDWRDPVRIAADTIRSWKQDELEIVLLKGNAYVAQGMTRIRASQAVLWIHAQKPGGSTTLEIYAEDEVRVRGVREQLNLDEYFERLHTSGKIDRRAKRKLSGSALDDPLYRRAEAQRIGVWSESPILQAAYEQPSASAATGPVQGRRVRVFPRSSLPFQSATVNVSDRQQVLVFTGGINLIIDNVRGIGTVDILADHMVLWTPSLWTQQIAQQETTQPHDVPLEVYLEGNVVIRQGQRMFEATEAYYDITHHVAVANNAQIETYSEKLGASIFLRARKLRQTAKDRFVAEQAQLTPSRFPDPTYELRIDRATLEDFPSVGLLRDQPPARLGDSPPGRSPRRRITAANSTLLFEQIPLLYWPYIEGSIEDINTPLRSVRLGQSRTFGTEILTSWDLFRLLGWAQPENLNWGVNLDYLSNRGPAFGSELNYRGDELLGIGGPYWGATESYWIHDTGKDRLGGARRNTEPERKNRGRYLLRHRQQLHEDMMLALEFAWISDINFLEEYFEREWEEGKDQETSIYLKKQRDNWAWSIITRGRILDFVTTTDWLPRLDHYWIGEPLFGHLSYFTHSSLAYMDLLGQDRSLGDIAPFSDPPAIVGSRLDTSHELDWPFSVGSVRVVPYLVGRLSSWSRTIDNGDETRLYGAVGTRATMPLWRVYPEVESQLLNLHGLAHKILFRLDYFLAESNVDFSSLPEYDELDEDSQQAFRQRFTFRDYTSLGTLFPPELDPRLFAVRTGLLTHTEAIDDLHIVRFGVRQRLQTKRGIPGARRVIDWMVLDLGAALFPQADRDNFGETFGQLNYDYQWHVGDRTSILSDGWFDTFGNGPRVWNLGVWLERPPRGSIYVGYTSLEPISSRVARASYDYYMSPKWVSSLSTSYDFGESRNLGQALVLTRIGADLIFRLGLTFNPLRDDFGVGVALVPRIMPQLATGTGSFRRGLPLQYAPVE